MIRVLLLFLMLSVPSMPVKAADYDLTPLHEMVLSLQDLGPLISEAQRNTDRAERFKFNYQNLISDIAIIHNGLVSAINGKEDRKHKVRALFIEYGYVGRTAESKYLTMLKRELEMLKSVALSLVPHSSEAVPVRKINFLFIASDFSSVIDAITVALAGSGDRPRRFPALGGNNL